MSKYVIDQKSNGMFYFILKSPSGLILFQSQDYETFISVMNGIASVQKHATTENIEYEDKFVK